MFIFFSETIFLTAGERTNGSDFFSSFDEIKIRPVMYLALSYDHRIIDGKDSVSFLKTIKENLEDPRRLFLNI